MRPIDADVLIPLIQEDKIEGKTLDIVKALGDGLQAETLNQACDRHIKIINGLPTIDAVPVKHGEWIDDGGLYRCSSCNHLWSELWWTENCPIERMLKIMPYCPNCGADMRERKDDDN